MRLEEGCLGSVRAVAAPASIWHEVGQCDFRQPPRCIDANIHEDGIQKVVVLSKLRILVHSKAKKSTQQTAEVSTLRLAI